MWYNSSKIISMHVGKILLYKHITVDICKAKTCALATGQQALAEDLISWGQGPVPAQVIGSEWTPPTELGPGHTTMNRRELPARSLHSTGGVATEKTAIKTTFKCQGENKHLTQKCKAKAPTCVSQLHIHRNQIWGSDICRLSKTEGVRS